MWRPPASRLAGIPPRWPPGVAATAAAANCTPYKPLQPSAAALLKSLCLALPGRRRQHAGRTCFWMPSVMSTCVRMQFTHMLVGFGVMLVPHRQHNLRREGRHGPQAWGAASRRRCCRRYCCRCQRHACDTAGVLDPPWPRAYPAHAPHAASRRRHSHMALRLVRQEGTRRAGRIGEDHWKVHSACRRRAAAMEAGRLRRHSPAAGGSARQPCALRSDEKKHKGKRWSVRCSLQKRASARKTGWRPQATGRAPRHALPRGFLD